mmetsp:Transcript_29186/g.64795  ORF Transcript_29186/g.64795 Transcript_29186/m.64795 type:complete len:286 (+) Transcript_29186:234-1091(+)
MQRRKEHLDLWTEVEEVLSLIERDATEVAGHCKHVVVVGAVGCCKAKRVLPGGDFDVDDAFLLHLRQRTNIENILLPPLPEGPCSLRSIHLVHLVLQRCQHSPPTAHADSPISAHALLTPPRGAQIVKLGKVAQDPGGVRAYHRGTPERKHLLCEHVLPQPGLEHQLEALLFHLQNAVRYARQHHPAGVHESLYGWVNVQPVLGLSRACVEHLHLPVGGYVVENVLDHHAVAALEPCGGVQHEGDCHTSYNSCASCSCIACCACYASCACCASCASFTAHSRHGY